MAENRRDRLRELLDAVLKDTDGPADGAPRRLDDMAEGAFSSPYHFSRLLSRATGEPPVAMRRRVLLERAAWQLAQGTTVLGEATGSRRPTASTSTRPRRCGSELRSSR